MARTDMKVTAHIELMFEGNPIDLEFVKQAIKEKIEALPQGCPANNTTCKHLWSGACIHPHPEVEHYEGKTTCGSYEWANPPGSS